MEVEVCDICNDNLAKVKCDMCENVICLECGIILYFRESQTSDYYMFLERTLLTNKWLANESIKNFILCDKCAKETKNVMNDFMKLPKENKVDLERELIKIMKEKMESLLLANKI